MMSFAIVIEKGANNYSAYSPDLPGCVSTGRSIEELKQNMREAIDGHLKAMQEAGEPLPEPTAVDVYLEAVDIAG
jgi:predicted RNase H-like HicB family nuclease